MSKKRSALILLGSIFIGLPLFSALWKCFEIGTFTTFMALLLNNTLLCLPGFTLNLQIPLIFVILPGFPLLFLGLLYRSKAEKEKAKLKVRKGLAYMLDPGKHIFEEVKFNISDEQIEWRNKTFHIDPDKFLIHHSWRKDVPHLYFDSSKTANPIEPLDIGQVESAQLYRKFNPVYLKLIVEERLTQGFLKSLIYAAGRRVFKVRYLIIIFIAIAVLVVVINTLYPQVFKGLLGGK